MPPRWYTTRAADLSAEIQHSASANNDVSMTASLLSAMHVGNCVTDSDGVNLIFFR